MSSEYVNFAMSVGRGEQMQIEITACRPGTWRYDHKVYDLNDL